MWNRHGTCVSLSYALSVLDIPFYATIGASFERCDDVSPDDPCDDCFTALSCYDCSWLERFAAEMKITEKLIESLLGCPLCPKQHCEVVDYPTNHCRCSDMKDHKGNWKVVELPTSCTRKIGVLKKELIGSASVEYSDFIESYFPETATVTFTLPHPIDACEIVPYFFGYSGDGGYRIATPMKVEVNNLQVIMTFCSQDLIKPDFYKCSKLGNNRKKSLCCDWALSVPDVDCPFVAVIDIYREYVDESCPQAELIHNGSASECSCGECLVCKTESYPACIQDTNLCGLVRVIPVAIDANGNCTNLSSCPSRREPDKVKVNYVDFPHSDCGNCWDIDDRIKRAIVVLTAAWLPTKLCNTCAAYTEILSHYQGQHHYSRIGGEVEARLSMSVSQSEKNNRYYGQVVRVGSVGELQAWSLLKDLLHYRGC